MKPLIELQMPLIPAATGLPSELANFPRFRYMGSKFRLLPWIHDTLSDIDFESATDAFSGSTRLPFRPHLLHGRQQRHRSRCCRSEIFALLQSPLGFQTEE